MKAVVFSGTTEGRRFSKKLAALGAEVTVCVATPLGAEEQGEMAGITVHAGRLGSDAMAALLTGADLCVDATHPYAVDVTRNIRAAAAQAGVEYRRLLRARSPLPEDCVVFGTAAQAAEYLAAFPLKGVGTDAISIDPMDTVDYPVHKILLGTGFVNTENLCNLASLVGKTFPYATLPLRFKNADGSPVRAVAMPED